MLHVTISSLAVGLDEGSIYTVDIMSASYQSGRNGGMGPRRDSSKVRANSSLPKGNQYTTPDREEVRTTEREKKAIADRQFVEGRKALSEALTKDPEAVGRVWDKLVALAEKDGHYKAIELVLGYAYGKPIATTENFSSDLSGDDLFDATEQVGEQLKSEGWKVYQGGRAEDAG